MSCAEFSINCQAANTPAIRTVPPRPHQAAQARLRGLASSASGPCPVSMASSAAHRPGSSRATRMLRATASGTEIRTIGAGRKLCARSSTTPGTSQATRRMTGMAVTRASARTPGLAQPADAEPADTALQHAADGRAQAEVPAPGGLADGRALVQGGGGQDLGLRTGRRVLLVGEHRLALGQSVVRQGLGDGGVGLLRCRPIGVLARGRPVLGLAADRLVAVLP